MRAPETTAERVKRLQLEAHALALEEIEALEKLLVTEVDRRKARVEIERGAAVEDTTHADDVVADRMRLIQGGAG